MNVVCDVTNCPHRNGKFCGKDFTIINQAGQCNEFYMDNGTPRPKPLFVIDAECKDYFKNKEKEITDDSKESDGERKSSDNGKNNNKD